MIDPERAFGIPIFARGAARVETVLNRFKAGESVDSLTEEFGIPAVELFDVLRVHHRRRWPSGPRFFLDRNLGRIVAVPRGLPSGAAST